MSDAKPVNGPAFETLCTREMAIREPRVREMEGHPRAREVGSSEAERSKVAGKDLEALFRDAGPELYRAIYGFTGGRRQLAEDAVAEAFARAIEHADGIRDPLAWIYRTAFRLATRELQREKRLPPRLPDPSPGIDPFEVKEVLSALAQVSPNQRAAVLLHDVEGFTGPEVGRLLGMSSATVRVHLFRGRKRVRALLSIEEDSDG
jgi:RNA polymerase sigma-70 factor (ECF subfamily)